MYIKENVQNKEILKKLHKESPLIHCITNPISMNQSANAVLGLGAKPIMAEHPAEVKEITETAEALLINLGNISDTRMAAMEISMKAALSKGIPVVLDAVGVSCSELRRKYIAKLLDIRSKFVSNESSFFLIKGNYSEIKTLSNHSYRSKGVDADTKLACTEVSDEAKALAKEYKVCVLASGAVDIVTDGEKVSCIRSGVPMMGNVTGTGCMLGAICACFLSVQKDIDAVICACVCFGIAGEYADANLNKRTRMDDFGHVYGNGSFMVQLLDEIYSMTDEKISLDRFNICERQER